jgi:hypothetical protein
MTTVSCRVTPARLDSVRQSYIKCLCKTITLAMSFWTKRSETERSEKSLISPSFPSFGRHKGEVGVATQQTWLKKYRSRDSSLRSEWHNDCHYIPEQSLSLAGIHGCNYLFRTKELVLAPTGLPLKSCGSDTLRRLDHGRMAISGIHRCNATDCWLHSTWCVVRIKGISYLRTTV